MSGTKKKAKILIQGIVQGVGFRPFIYRLATNLNLFGTVRNLGDAGVEVTLEGSQGTIRKFLDKLPREKPPLSRIQSLDVEYFEPEGIKEFRILKSGGGGWGSGTIPPDTAMCDKCLMDLRDSENRYYGYWATSCVDCGPRFTVIRSLPYDRPRTSMDDFPMCNGCKMEYEDPGNRRYHAQTIACPKCGPQLFTLKSSDDPILQTAQIIREGGAAAIKGIGGTHLACNAYDDPAVQRLKRRLRRPYKPLAIMARDLKMVEEFAEIGEDEREALESIKRPIVVLDQLPDSPLSGEVAHGLHNVGVMLPYTGAHHLLFDHIDFPVVMTSANMPGRPMLVKNDEIISKLDGIADQMLLHDRRILARCDDSVVRFSGGARRFLRRSRGWAPAPIRLDCESVPVLALGAEFDNTVAIFNEGNCYVSQFLGEVDDLETLDFLKESIEHLSSITGLDVPDKIACDLHPGFMTTELAEEMSEDPIRVQHHHAHLAGVLGEIEIREAVGIAADGVGYGTDGTIWGGEVLHVTRSKFDRLGGLSDMLMPGGDRATRYPARMIAGVLYESRDLPELLSRHAEFPGGDEERKVVERQVETRVNSPITSSAGRFLDAVSSLLDVCQERTYEGEPAMRLEALAVGSKPFDLRPELISANGRRVLDVQRLMRDLIELKEGGARREDIAATAQNCLAEGLAEIAVDLAVDRGVDVVALSGGVAYNDAIGKRIKEVVEGSGLDFVTNEKLPCGDGGISFGQVIVATSED